MSKHEYSTEEYENLRRAALALKEIMMTSGLSLEYLMDDVGPMTEEDVDEF